MATSIRVGDELYLRRAILDRRTSVFWSASCDLFYSKKILMRKKNTPRSIFQKR
jgi:hypothetical protein